jgi:competence protein ComEC
MVCYRVNRYKYQKASGSLTTHCCLCCLMLPDAFPFFHRLFHVTYNKNKFLFTGDAEKAAETDMVKMKQTLQADVIKVGHHGAKTSSNSEFLKVVKPKYAVISVGKNAYGHPTKDVLNRYKAVKATVYRTDQKGNIVISSTGTKISVSTSR